VRRPRRHDPDRKTRILDAAIDVMAEHGVAGTTHRLIAAAADVPLGSLTYHFTSLEDLRAQAFRRHAERMSVVYAEHFDGVQTHEQFVDAVTDLIQGDAGADTNDWAIAYELYLAALRDPALREVTETWMRTSRAVLERFVDPVTARGVDALIEGLTMNKNLSTTPYPGEQIRRMVARAAGDSSPRRSARPSPRPRRHHAEPLNPSHATDRSRPRRRKHDSPRHDHALDPPRRECCRSRHLRRVHRLRFRLRQLGLPDPAGP